MNEHSTSELRPAPLLVSGWVGGLVGGWVDVLVGGWVGGLVYGWVLVLLGGSWVDGLVSE